MRTPSMFGVVVRAWHGSWSGPAIKILVATMAIPLAVNVLFRHDPPLGIYLNGLVIGALYALLAMGLILIYRANRIINFAQASIGIVPAVLAVILISEKDLPYLAVVPIVLVGSALLGALMDLGVIRVFERSPRLFVTIATIGFAQLFAFFELLLPIILTPPTEEAARAGTGISTIGYQGQIDTPASNLTAEIGGVFFSGDHLIAIIVIAATGLGLGAFLRYTSIGIAVRAAAENDDRARLVGIPVRRISTIVWILAGLLSGIGIFLRAPLVGMPVGGTLLGPGILLYALAAAVIARMESLPMAFLAGLGIGVIDQTTFFGTRDATVSTAMMLPVILVALLVQRKRFSRAHDVGGPWQAMREFRPTPIALRRVRDVIIGRRVVWFFGAGALLTLPFMVGDLKYPDAALMLIYALVGVSLVILTGWGGQISLGQWAISGIGAAVAGGLAANHGVDFFVTMLVAGLAGAAFSAAVGIPALRVPGLFLAVTTLALAANMQFFFLNRRYFGWLLPDPTSPVSRPLLYGRIDARSDLVFYYVCLGFLALALAAAWSLRRSRSGRVIIGTRDNPAATQAYGVNLVRTRLSAFALSGFIAGLAGALFSYLNGAVDAPAFTPTASADLFTMAVIGGLTSLAGPVLGAGYLIMFRRFLPDWNSLHLIAQGAGVFLVLRFAPGGLAEIGYRIRDRFLRNVAHKHDIDVPDLTTTAAGGASGAAEPDAPISMDLPAGALGAAAAPTDNGAGAPASAGSPQGSDR